jgi:hypothetical protein
MTRLSVTAALAAFIFATASFAEDYTGKIKNLDVKKREMTVTSEGKDVSFTIDKDVSVFYQAKAAKKGQTGGLEPVPGGLNGLKVGNEVTITTEKKNENEIISLIKLEGAPTNPKK